MGGLNTFNSTCSSLILIEYFYVLLINLSFLLHNTLLPPRSLPSILLQPSSPICSSSPFPPPTAEFHDRSDLLSEPSVLGTWSPAVFNTYKNTFHFLSQSIDRFLCSFQQVFTALSAFIGIKERHFLIFMGIC